MRTTVDVPDSVFREAKIEATRRGISLKEFFLGALEREVRRGRPANVVPKELPVIPLSRTGPIGSLTNAEIDELLG